MADLSAAQMAQAREAFLGDLLAMGIVAGEDGPAVQFRDGTIVEVDQLLHDAHAAVERHQGPEQVCPGIPSSGDEVDGYDPGYSHDGWMALTGEPCPTCNGTGKVPGRWWPNPEMARAFRVVMHQPNPKLAVEVIADGEWDKIEFRGPSHGYIGSLDRVDADALRQALADALREG